MLEGLAILFGVVHAMAGEGWWPRRGPAVAPVPVYRVATEPKADETFQAYLPAGAPAGDPILGAIGEIPDQVVTRTRAQLVSDDDWYRSSTFNEYFEVGGIDHQLISVFQVSDEGATSVIALSRALGERDFSPHEKRVLNFFHAELGRLIGGPLAPEHHVTRPVAAADAGIRVRVAARDGALDAEPVREPLLMLDRPLMAIRRCASESDRRDD